MLYFLFESSLGFALFKVNDWDKISSTDAKVIKGMDDFQTFKKVASCEANMMFQGHNVAFEVLRKLNIGEMPEELTDFLKTNLPSVKKQNFQLAVQEKVLATKINEALKIKCVSGEVYLDIFRSIRKHLSAFLINEAGEFIRQHVPRKNFDRQFGYRSLLRQVQHQVRRKKTG